MFIKNQFILLSSMGFILSTGLIYATPAVTNTMKLQEMSNEFSQREAVEQEEATEFADKYKVPIREEFLDGSIIEIQKIENGIPLYYITHNANAAISTRTQHLWTTPFSVTGDGYTALGEWDGGAVRGTHQELNGRVTQVDGAPFISDHATHVAGTLIASGVVSNAKGMAHKATLKAYDWNSDNSEMSTAAANGLEVSNHSYGYITGWHGTSDWFGDTNIAQDEAYSFGFYDSGAQDWDTIAHDAPNYLIVKSAGNDRNDIAPPPGTAHSHNFSGTYYDTHNSDGFDNGGYDTISNHGVAKNILTIAAVDDVLNYTSSSSVNMSTFSGWGPADDGRIKPDISGNGVGLYSSLGGSDTDYASYNGTSMSSPNVTGTLALIQQHYQNTHSANPMRSATLKALVLHTADEAGDDIGPDYRFGWGLLNAKKAAEKISEDVNGNVMDELSLANGGTYTRDIVLSGSDLDSLKVTIVWTDPAGTPVSPALDPIDKMLVNNLDLKIVKDGTTYYPWKLDRDNPAAAATQNSQNSVDNVEQVFLETPTEGIYTITVDHTGTLGADQAFSIVLSTGGILDCHEGYHYKQGTLECIVDTIPEISLPYLPEYDGLIQGTMDIDTTSNLTDFNLTLPVCVDGSLPTVQGTTICL